MNYNKLLAMFFVIFALAYSSTYAILEHRENSQLELLVSEQEELITLMEELNEVNDDIIETQQELININNRIECEQSIDKTHTLI